MICNFLYYNYCEEASRMIDEQFRLDKHVTLKKEKKRKVCINWVPRGFSTTSLTRSLSSLTFHIYRPTNMSFFGYDLMTNIKGLFGNNLFKWNRKLFVKWNLWIIPKNTMRLINSTKKKLKTQIKWSLHRTSKRL